MELSKRSLKKIDAILKGASIEFNKYGYNKTTMEGIAYTAGVSKVTLYKYFEDKQVLYEHILKEIYMSEFHRIEEVIGSEKSFREKIDQIINIRLEKYYDDNILRVDKNYIRSNDLIEFIEQRVDIMDSLNHTLYEQGKNEGLIRSDLTDETLNQYFQIIRSGLVANFTTLREIGNGNLGQLFDILYAGVLGCNSKNKGSE